MTGTPQPPSPTTTPFRTATAAPTSTPVPSALLMQTEVGDARDMEWSPAGDAIAVTNEQGVTLLDATDLSVKDQFEIERGGGMLSFSPEGVFLAVINQPGFQLFVLELADEVRVRTDDPPFNCSWEFIKFGFAGMLYEAVYCPPDSLGIGGITQSLEEGPTLALFRDYEFQSHPIAVSPMGDWAAIGLIGGGINIYGPGTRETLRTLPYTPFYGMTFSPNGDLLVSMEIGCIIHFISTSDWQIARQLSWCEEQPQFGPEAPGLSFSADGTKLAAGTGQGEVVVWDMASGDALVRFPAPTSRKHHSLSFSPDGSKIASVGEDGLLQIWAIDG